MSGFNKCQTQFCSLEYDHEGLCNSDLSHSFNKHELAELREAQLMVERLRLLCVTQRMLLAKREEHHYADAQGFRAALASAFSFIERLQNNDCCWTHADGQRLEEIRKLVTK